MFTRSWNSAQKFSDGKFCTCTWSVEVNFKKFPFSFRYGAPQFVQNDKSFWRELSYRKIHWTNLVSNLTQTGLIYLGAGSLCRWKQITIISHDWVEFSNSNGIFVSYWKCWYENLYRYTWYSTLVVVLSHLIMILCYKRLIVHELLSYAYVILIINWNKTHFFFFTLVCTICHLDGYCLQDNHLWCFYQFHWSLQKRWLIQHWN